MKERVAMGLIGLFLSIGSALAQSHKVTGKVTSGEDGEPIVGASILVEGTTIGTITDVDGKFVLNNVPEDAKNLQVSYIGMQSQLVKINRQGGP